MFTAPLGVNARIAQSCPTGAARPGATLIFGWNRPYNQNAFDLVSGRPDRS